MLVVYIILLSERGSERWSRGVRQRERGSERWSQGVRQRERWMEYVETNSILVEFEL